MKKFVAMLLSLVLCLGLFAGCGGKNYAVEESTLFILKDGKIISTDVEAFDSSYDEVELEEYVKAAIKEYTDEHGEDSVKLNELKVEEGKATLIIEYATAGDYTAFTGIELFAGSILDALGAGYSFDVDFASISDGVATECSNQDIMQENDLKVVVFKGNGNVNVAGKILFASVMNTKLIDENTIAIASGYNLLGLAIEDVSDTEEDIDMDYDEEFEGDVDFEDEGFDEEFVDEGAIGDDELAIGEDDLLAQSPSEEEPEVEFDFDEELDEEFEDDFEDAVSYTNVYTYIIYK